MKRPFVLFIIGSLLVFGLVLFCHRHDIKNMRQDFQAYQKASLLPEDYDNGVTK